MSPACKSSDIILIAGLKEASPANATFLSRKNNINMLLEKLNAKREK
jgi:hypothetical protein